MAALNKGLRDKIVSALNFPVEYDELLGQGKGQRRRCYNRSAHANEDHSPSLHFSPTNGGYRCSGCGEQGDIFTLYMRVKSWTYPQTLEYLLRKVGLWEETNVRWFHERAAQRGGGPLYKPLSSASVRTGVSDSYGLWRDEQFDFMFERYGLTKETLRAYRLAPTYGAPTRLQIPIPEREFPNGQLPRILNIRKHDVFRQVCTWYNRETGQQLRKYPPGIGLAELAKQELGPWEPQWKGTAGKVVNVEGHGAIYLYPFHVIYEAPFLYLVGGELKALLLNQLGIPAVCFTAGEGQYSKDLLPFFLGKRVRVLMDFDDTGVKGALNVGQELADCGAYVELGKWQEEIVALLPKKGDVTDLLRLTKWNPAILNDDHALRWEELPPRSTQQEILDNMIGEEEVPSLALMKDISYNALVDTDMIDGWGKLDVMLSGKDSQPHVVPREVHFLCDRGRSNPIPGRCASCPIFSKGGEMFVRFSPLSQVEMVGLTGQKLALDLKSRVKVPDRCSYPETEITWGSVEACMVQAPMDSDVLSAYSFEPRPLYVVTENSVGLEENKTYKVGGKIIQDPRSGRFTMAATQVMKTFSSWTQWKPDPQLHQRLLEVTHGKLGYLGLLHDLRDNVLRVYEQDPMVLSILLSFFMPFQFKLGSAQSERVCPAVMILGDSTVGKSTVARRLMQFYNNGRYLAADSDPTFAGLVGGYAQFNGRPIFNWGILPLAHRTLAALDEFQMLPVEDIAKLGNTLTSGIAERTTAYGTKRAAAHVRLLYLCNPRGERRLTMYRNPLEAVREIMGTTQALGRLEYAHIEFGAHRSLFKRLDVSEQGTSPHLYTEELARYHLQWAWNMKPDNVIITNPTGLMIRAAELAEEFGDHPLLFMAQARWKVARIAAGFAALSYSLSKDNYYSVYVQEEHVDFAINFLRRLYQDWLVSTTADEDESLPKAEINEAPLFRLFRLAFPGDYSGLNMFVTSDKWTAEDIQTIFGRYTKDFIKLVQVDLGLVSRRRADYVAKDERLANLVTDYLVQRDNGGKQQKGKRGRR